MEERLQKILAAAGVGSRRHCETLIAAGRVSVNGETAKIGTKADPQTSVICVDGNPIDFKKERLYFALNKPCGYACTRKDPHAPKTVMNLLSDVKEYIYPVGRLDVDTSGLLILTNDGDFAKLLTHPSHKIDKKYRVVAEGWVSASTIQRLERGIALGDGITAPASARLIKYDAISNSSELEIIIHEGRKRQIRRMMKAAGHPVLELKRVAIGFLTLEGIPEGRYRPLTKHEVDKLRKLALRSPHQKGEKIQK